MPSHPEKSRGTTFVLWGSGLVALVLVVLAVHYLTRERLAVTTAKVSYQDVVKTSPTIGKVEPVEVFQPHAQTAGIIAEIYVHDNEQVRPGQLLMRMEDAGAQERLASAQAAVQAAELAVNDIAHGGTEDELSSAAGEISRAKLQQQQDAASLTALQRLQQQGDAAPAEIAAAQQRLQMDDSRLRGLEQHSTQRYGGTDRAGAQAKLADARAKLADAQAAITSANIVSPIAGTVYWLPVSRFDNVVAGDELIDVADLNRIQVTAYFDEPEVGGLAAGQPVKIIWDAKPRMVWHGHISVAPTTIIAYNTRNVGECQITVDDAHGDLQPNANVTVTVTTMQHSHVLSLPREALRTEPGETYVFRIIHDKLVRTPVQVGSATNNTRLEITGGLAEGDLVALGATATNRDLTDGLEVKPVE